MNQAEQILVIILSTFLALFLLVSIFLVVEALKVVKGVKAVVEKADSIITSAESITEVFQNVSGPLALAKLVQNIMKFTNKAKKSNKKDKR